MKTKVKSVSVGEFGFDSILVTIDSVDTQICFDKETNVSQYLNKIVDLNLTDGIYTITELTK